MVVIDESRVPEVAGTAETKTMGGAEGSFISELEGPLHLAPNSFAQPSLRPAFSKPRNYARHCHLILGMQNSMCYGPRWVTAHPRGAHTPAVSFSSPCIWLETQPADGRGECRRRILGGSVPEPGSLPGRFPCRWFHRRRERRLMLAPSTSPCVWGSIPPSFWKTLFILSTTPAAS